MIMHATKIKYAIACLIVVFAFPLIVLSQCLDHPDKKTALRFSNQTKYELTFFVDEDEEGTAVQSANLSDELVVEPGRHMVRARAVINGENIWVWKIDEVPEGQVCTWTIVSP